MFIALISAMMVLLGAVLIIRPKDRAAPQPWEMGTLEVEMEEELAREARGISEEEEMDSTLRPQKEDEDQISQESTETPDAGLDEDWWDPDASVGDLLESDTEEIGLQDLNVLADDLDDEEDDSDNIDTSFIDEALED